MGMGGSGGGSEKMKWRREEGAYLRTHMRLARTVSQLSCAPIDILIVFFF